MCEREREGGRERLAEDMLIIAPPVDIAGGGSADCVCVCVCFYS